jgi:hypothetical protein
MMPVHAENCLAGFQDAAHQTPSQQEARRKNISRYMGFYVGLPVNRVAWVSAR